MRMCVACPWCVLGEDEPCRRRQNKLVSMYDRGMSGEYGAKKKTGELGKVDLGALGPDIDGMCGVLRVLADDGLGRWGPISGSGRAQR